MNPPVAAASADIQIRSLQNNRDYQASVALQRRIWGDDIREIVPPAILKVSQEQTGPLVASAGSGAGVQEPGYRTPAEAAPARHAPVAGSEDHVLDFRPTGIPERVS